VIGEQVSSENVLHLIREPTGAMVQGQRHRRSLVELPVWFIVLVGADSAVVLNPKSTPPSRLGSLNSDFVPTH